MISDFCSEKKVWFMPFCDFCNDRLISFHDFCTENKAWLKSVLWVMWWEQGLAQIFFMSSAMRTRLWLKSFLCVLQWKQGYGSNLFYDFCNENKVMLRYVRFFSVLKKERSVLFCSFLEFLATYETQKNVPFFLKERKRTQRTFRSF